MRASKNGFKAHADLDQLTKSKKSISFHMSILRCITHSPGNTFYCKSRTDANHKSNPQQNKLGFADGNLGEKVALHDK